MPSDPNLTAPVYFLTIPGLRRKDLRHMPNLSALMVGGDRATLKHSFPAVTWPAQANMLTGELPKQHGVVANGFYWREKQQVEMWTAWNEVIQRPQIWDLLKERNPELKTAAWFPMLSKGCAADFVCMPAPIHQPDGSEDLWCHTKPQEFYGELLDSLGHFPLKHFWGPLAGIQSSQWIADSMVLAAKKFQPDFSYVYLPHLDYAAQKFGPNSKQADGAVQTLDALLGPFAEKLQSQHAESIHWVVASEYVISEVDHVTFPNRVLRKAGLLKVQTREDGEHLDFENSAAWALVDHQFSHVFVKDSNPSVIEKVASLFAKMEGVAATASGSQRGPLNLDHPRSGDVILVSCPNSWQAYYWWHDDSLAPGFAKTVDIHRKPGYDPVELFFDMATKSVPLDASLVKGSHGLGWSAEIGASDEGLLLSSVAGSLNRQTIADSDICDWLLG